MFLHEPPAVPELHTETAGVGNILTIRCRPVKTASLLAYTIMRLTCNLTSLAKSSICAGYLWPGEIFSSEGSFAVEDSSLETHQPTSV